MKNQIAMIDQLLEKPCYIIDFLPERVIPNSKGNFLMMYLYYGGIGLTVLHRSRSITQSTR